MNFFGSKSQVTDEGLIASIDGYSLPVANSDDKLRDGSSLTIGIRPEDFRLCEPEQAKLTVNMLEKLGSETLAYFESPSAKDILISAKIPRNSKLNIGDTLHLDFDDAKCYLFDENGLSVNS